MIRFKARWNSNNLVRTDSSELEDARMNLFLPPADAFIPDSFATRADNVPRIQGPLQFCQFLLPVANAV